MTAFNIPEIDFIFLVAKYLDLECWSTILWSVHVCNWANFCSVLSWLFHENLFYFYVGSNSNVVFSQMFFLRNYFTHTYTVSALNSFAPVVVDSAADMARQLKHQLAKSSELWRWLWFSAGSPHFRLRWETLRLSIFFSPLSDFELVGQSCRRFPHLSSVFNDVLLMLQHCTAVNTQKWCYQYY